MSAIVDTLTATLQAAPDSWQCRLALIEALVAEGRNDEAYAVLSNVTELPADTESCLMAAKSYGILEPESGIQVLDGMIASDPTYAPAYLEKSRLLFEAGQLELAQKQYEAATTFDSALVDPELAAKLGLNGIPVPVVVEEETPAAQPVVAEEIPPALPVQPPAALDRNEVYYPAPGEFPTVTLSEALAAGPVAPLVHPDSIPAFPELAYQEEVPRADTIHTQEQEYLEALHNVEVHTAHYEEPVSYDYQAPDDSIFEPTIGEDDIYVGAMVTETGEPVANLQESIRRSKAEKEAEIAQRENIAKIQSLTVALFSLAGICLLMIMAVVAVPRPAPPQIVASSVIAPTDDSLEQTTIKQTRITPTPTQSASAMSMEVMTVASASNLSMMSFDSPTMDLGAGTGMDFGSSMSFGDTVGGGMVSFFGGKSTGKRILFILDDSKSMRPHQIELRNDELEKTFRTLSGVQYQVVLFAGGGYFAEDGWGYKVPPGGKGAPKEYVSPDNKYSFNKDGIVGKIKAPKWKDANSSNKRETIRFIKNAKKFYGTDWGKAFEVGFEMKPAPDVIFFMSDGTGNTSEEEIAKANRSNGKAKINTLAMQTASGAKSFNQIAKDSGGNFSIVDKDGKPIDGEEFMKDPKKFAKRL